MDENADPEAILASNTSTLDLDRIAAVTRRPERVVGLHFFSPANVMKLLEIVRGARTAPAVLASAAAFGKAIGKVAVVAGVCDGFIGNRMFEEYLRQAYYLLEEGALPAQVDAALERWGMAMGPLRVMDLVGQDIGWSIRKRRAVDQPDRPYSKLPDIICEMGRFGQKTGAGFYLYTDGRTASPDPVIDALIVAHSTALGVTRRSIDDQEIVDRCIYALVNEGARILEEGIAYRPVDVDMVTVFGYGFPADRGGPMFYANRCGITQVVRRMQQFAAGANGWTWKAAASLLKGSIQGVGRHD
jgi:3-hydroxyacyl-CoA dehydrogenase